MKSKWLGLVLIGLGAFLVMAAVMAQVWAPDVVKRTPIDVNDTTNLTGHVQKFDGKTGKLKSDPAYAVILTKVDSHASDGDVAVFAQTTCVVVDDGSSPHVCIEDSDPRLVSAEIDVFATDRHTALSVNDTKYLPDDAVPHEGLVNKWPFDAQKKTYPYWDFWLEKPLDAVYDRTEDVKGMKTYVYKVTEKDGPIEIAPGINGTYDVVKQIWVEPETGAIINQTEDQQRYLEDGSKVLDLQLEFTDAQQAKFVKDVGDQLDQIHLLLKTVPIVGYAVGIPLLLIGFALVFLRRRDKGDGGSAVEAEQPPADPERPTAVSLEK